MSNYKLINNRVERLLSEHPELRDDDRKLQVAIWKEDIFGREELPFSQLFVLRDDQGKYVITNPESIRRSRQKVQEMFPRLRPITEKRADTEPDWRTELGYTSPGSTKPYPGDKEDYKGDDLFGGPEKGKKGFSIPSDEGE